MVSPPSAGLFQRVIQQSNPAGFSYTTPGYMAVYGDVRRLVRACAAAAHRSRRQRCSHASALTACACAHRRTQALASQAGCGRPPKGVSQLECLRNASSAAIMSASAAVVSSYYDVARGSGWTVLDGVLQWGPVLDGAQLPVQPMAAVAAGALPLRSVDVLLGHNTDEVATFLDASHYAAAHPTLLFETVLLSVFGLRGASAVKAQYVHYGLPAGVEQLDLIMTDYWFRCAKEAVGAAVVAAGGRAWSYRFAHNTSFGEALWGPLVGLPQCVRKVCHTAELVFVFGNTGEWQFTDEERAFSDALIAMWANFAHTGDPGGAPQEGRAATARRLLRDGDDEPDGELPSWPPYANDTRLSLVLEPGWGQEDSAAVCPFWDALGYAGH